MPGFIMAGCIVVFITVLLSIRYIVTKKGHEFPKVCDVLMLGLGLITLIFLAISLVVMSAYGSKVELRTGVVQKVITINDGENSQVRLELNVNDDIQIVECGEKQQECRNAKKGNLVIYELRRSWDGTSAERVIIKVTPA